MKETIRTSGTGYEKLYFDLWETAGRYREFCRFRVIGKSHDDRMIPMLEIGEGSDMIFCLAGVDGRDQNMPGLCVNMAQEYCKAYESGWKWNDFYEIRSLLKKIRICLIPLLNPDGYEICRNGFGSIRNPVFRQMLRMQETAAFEFGYNARKIDLGKNFPTTYYQKSRMGEQPGSENETRALIRIFQEYRGHGLISFREKKRGVICYENSGGFLLRQQTFRMARHLKKVSGFSLEKCSSTQNDSFGSPEQFYIQTFHANAFGIEMNMEEEKHFEEIPLFVMEYLFLLTEK